MMLRCSSTFVCLAVLAGPASALDCAHAMVQSDLNECAGREFDAADAKLNQVYGQIVGRLARRTQDDAPDVKALLKATQRAWVAFRDAECDFKTSPSDGGSAHPMEMLGCRQTLTEKRTAELRAYLNCQPDTSDCPVPPAK